jgi:Ni/Co efflux regulator RcnB
MRRAFALLLLPLFATPAVAADMAERSYERESYAPPLERRVMVEERFVEEPVIEERIVIRRRPVVVSRTIVEDLPREDLPEIEQSGFYPAHRGWRQGYQGGSEWRGGW